MPPWYMMIRRPLAYLQTLLGVGIFSYRQELRERFPLRLLASVVLSCVVCYFSGRYFYPPTVESFADSLSRLSTQLVQYVAVFFTVWLTHKGTLWSALSLTSAGYCAQQIAGSVKTLLRLTPALDALSQTPWVLALDLFCYGGTYLLLYLLFRRSIEADDGDLEDRQRAVFSLAVLLLCVFNGRLTQDNMNVNTLSRFTESVYAVITSLLILMIQFGVMERVKLSRSVDAMRELVHEQHEQFRHSKQSVELVNEKYHDLKGLLEGFQGAISQEQIDKLKAKVGEYDTYVDTGSHVLDIVLAEKRALCESRGIELTAYLDGSALDFLEELELYSLIGNTLNNAIDAVSKLPQGERFILLAIKAEGDMLTIHAENPYAGELVMENDLPKSQRDQRYHGFGMRSMERIVEKYDGAITATPKDGMFYLDMILFKP